MDFDGSTIRARMILQLLKRAWLHLMSRGYTLRARFGIRIENEIVCLKDFDNEYGTFLKFDMLTVVPIDLELVDINYLDAVDIERLNKLSGKSI